MFTRLAGLVYRHRRIVVAAWLVLVAGLVIGGSVFPRLDSSMGPDPNSESMQAQQRLEQLGGPGPNVLVLVSGRSVEDPALAAAIGRAADTARRLSGVQRVIDPTAMRVPQLVTADRKATLVAVYLSERLTAADREAAAKRIQEAFRAVPAPAVQLASEDLLNKEFQSSAERDARRAELVALPVVLVVLVVVFGSLVAAGLPLVVAFVAIAGTLLLLLGLSYATKVSVVAINVVTMFGLGLAIDYSLLIVSRFREERANGLGVPDAIRRTVATAGTTVAYSGLTVAAALTGMLWFKEPIWKSLAYAGIGVVLVALLAAVTLVPALLGTWGRRIKPAGPSATEHGVFLRLSRFVQRHAVALVAVTAGLLLLLGVPFLSVRSRTAGTEGLPPSSAQRQAYEAIQQRFPGRGEQPISIVAQVSPSAPAFTAYLDQVRAIAGGAPLAVRGGLPANVAVVDIVPPTAGQGHQARQIVRAIHRLNPPFTAQVTGSAAVIVDLKDSLRSRLPFALIAIALITFVLLFLMTGSLVVPAKAIVMNLLSLTATFGALVWIFQDGHLANLLHFTPVGGVDLVIPIVIFLFAFGLSMDYEVFLLSRIKETYDETGDNDLAVALGLQRTGRIVTSAALLIVIVFLGFAAGSLLSIKQMGVGLAIAVLLDATVVRMLLVPAAMKLMGRANWWAPAALRRVHDRFGLREPPTTTQAPQALVTHRPTVPIH
jgi:RND superfamily putative drug exporter